MSPTLTQKPSKAQRTVLDLMHNGWQLANCTTFDGRCWLQQGGAGKGGETISVHGRTFAGLLDRELIQSDGYHFPTQTWSLAPRAKRLLSPPHTDTPPT